TYKQRKQSSFWGRFLQHSEVLAARNCQQAPRPYDAWQSGRTGVSMYRVLVVDDDGAVQRTLKRLFEPEGFTVELVPDGSSALAALRNEPADVVLLDLRLPGMPGHDVCREMKQQLPAMHSR